jgi:hypothetical protein
MESATRRVRAYLAREREEARGDDAAAASCQYWCRQASAIQGPGTYVLSFASFKLSRNCRPLAVVVSGVSALACDDSPCTQASHCQRICPLFRRRVQFLRASSAAGVLLRATWRGRREVKGLLVEPSRRAPSRSHPPSPNPRPASRPTPLAHRWSTTDDASPPRGVARTGTFWRFAGRPSPSPMAALAALRLAALSIFASSVVA